MARDPGGGTETTTAQREWLAAVRSATELSDLIALTDADSEHEAYFAAKQRWYDHRGAELSPAPAPDGLAGSTVEIDGRAYTVHGITHADTDAEGEFLRDHVTEFVESGHDVYCEQGIRPMYFADFADVCEMDDYRWAMQRCRDLDGDSHLDEAAGQFDGLREDIDSLTATIREAAFSVLNTDSDAYTAEVRGVLGDIASGFLTSHEDLATGSDFEAFTRTKRAAEDPRHLQELQHYYERRFLPQPLEREWLRRHDRELELVTHARNERMADYAVYHATAGHVHLIVGAAHQPGVSYYLEQHRDGERGVDQFEFVDG
ncbi:MAG: hypothetical protein ABEH35_05610 [Haloarculaceae archaeon]